MTAIKNISTEKFDNANHVITEALAEEIQKNKDTPGTAIVFLVHCLGCGNVHQGVVSGDYGMPPEQDKRQKMLAAVGDAMIVDNGIPLALFLCVDGHELRKHGTRQIFSVIGLTCDGRKNVSVIYLDKTDDSMQYVSHRNMDTGNPELSIVDVDFSDLEVVFAAAGKKILSASYPFCSMPTTSINQLAAVFCDKVIASVSASLKGQDDHLIISKLIEQAAFGVRFTVGGLREMKEYKREFDLDLLRN